MIPQPSSLTAPFALRVDRRLFLLGTLAALAKPSAASGGGRSSAGRTLVLLQLTGGNDGLATLVPYADDAYARARRTTRRSELDVLRLDDRVGLHPELTGLRALYERGRLALFEGVGYPEPNRSHFRSMDIWHAADPRGRALAAGWIGRCIERLEAPPPQAVVHFGARPPFALHSVEHGALCLTPLALRTAALGAKMEGGVMEGTDAAGVVEAAAAADPIALVRARMDEARAATAELQAALGRSAPRDGYPRSDLAADLHSAAALIHAELGVRVVSLELDGFDTHKDQRVRHDRLMVELDRALAAFAADLETSEAGRQTIVFAFSEFGRRVEENASAGTDHGSAGLAFALGARVHGGLQGKPPALDKLVDGDPAFTTDFRTLYARCIEHVFELQPADVLGGSFPPAHFV